METSARGQGWWLAAAALVLVAAAPARAGKIEVSNAGADSALCGSKRAPCRSISQAIANAVPGDTIFVGPGHYGDLDGDGQFDDPGDEAAQVGSGCQCMIDVSKAVTIQSRDGALATVIDAGGTSIDAVEINADGVAFGKPGKGFTLTRAGFAGIHTAAATAAATISGNASTKNLEGFVIAGTGHVVRGNVASGNDSFGFVVQQSGHLVSNNAASGNGDSGFTAAGGTVTFLGNVAADNLGHGFRLNAGAIVSRNAALGNRGFGAQVLGAVTLSRNNFAGNNVAVFDGSTNCGVRNESGAALTATQNFWGVPAGPGPVEPADDACNKGGGSTTVTDPASARETKIKLDVSL